MLVVVIYYSIRLPTLPLLGEIRPTVVKSCLNLSGGGNSYSGFLLICQVGFKGRGEILGSYLGDGPRYRVLVGELGGRGAHVLLSWWFKNF